MLKVSVIIPTRNRAELLRDAVVSVLHQTEQNFEVIVVDDQSSDAEAENVVRSLADPRVRYVRQPEQRGVGAARNVGLSRARAPYVAFLDDDDEWLPDKLAVQLRALEDGPPSVGGVYSARLTVHVQTGQVSTTRFRKPFSPWRANVITTSSLLVRRACFDAVGVFDERLTAGGDWEMWLRISQRFRLDYLDEILVKYRVHPQSITGTPLRHAPSRELILTKHAAYFRQHPRSFARRYKGLGMLYHRRGEVGKARQAFRTAIRIWPLEVRAYGGLLLSYLSSRSPGRLQAVPSTSSSDLGRIARS